MATQKIAVIGECMVEFSTQSDHMKRGFGGDTLNTAVYLARQTPKDKLQVHYVTGLGTDTFSDEMLAAWQQENVNTDLVARLENKLPGLYVIETDAQGERTFYYWRNDAAARFWLKDKAGAQVVKTLAEFDYLYISGISVAILDEGSRASLISLLAECRQAGGKVIFDNNYRPRLWSNKEEAQRVYRQVLANTNIAFLTLDDENLLWGEHPLDETIDRSRDLGVDEIIIKRGAESCIIVTDAGSEEVAAMRLAKEQVIDTTAAGDSFSAGYLAVRLMGGSVTDAALNGHLTASTVIQHRGAIIPLQAMPKINV